MLEKAEKTLIDYLDAWINSDYKKMVKFSQITWKREQKNDSINWMNVFYDDKKLINYNIDHSKRIGEATFDFYVKARIEFKGHTEDRILKARILCEKKAYKPDINGKWGVNPLSVLFGIKNKVVIDAC